METINDIIYELNGNPKTKALAKRIELARINDEQRWRKDIADTRRLTAERMMEGIELTEKTRCANCISRGNLITNEKHSSEPWGYDERIKAAHNRIEAAPNREMADDWLNQLVNLINGEIAHYMSQGVNYFSVDCGPWLIHYDKYNGEDNGSKLHSEDEDASSKLVFSNRL